ncbi:MAG: polysaccharide biosynthesis/export family protein, partial [Akkermansia sp.]
FILTIIMAISAMTTGLAQQDMDIVRVNTVIKVTAKAIPEEDVDTVSSQYTVGTDGTIRLPLLPSGQSTVRVAGLNSRQVEDALVRAYVNAKIYTSPTFLVQVDPNLSGVENSGMFVQVSGNVGAKKSVPYIRGITLLRAVLEAGDITDFGSRYVLVTRGGTTKTYDYFSVRDRALELKPNDQVFIKDRPMFEGRPNGLVP